jgi:trans-aconitate methyltransferase
VWKQAATLIDLLDPHAGEAVLDLGCGTGHLTARLAARGARVLGIDNSAEMIHEARQNYPDLSFELVDARALEFDEQFDGIFSNAVLHWIREAETVVRSIARALRPGGRFVAEFGGKGNVQAIHGALKRGVEALGGGSVHDPWYFPSVAEYTALLEATGLETTLATLFDRPTTLEGERGMRNWVEMFGGDYLKHVSLDRREEFFLRLETELRPGLYSNGCWHADYRRLRIVAHRSK